jgi:hypothetical protein
MGFPTLTMPATTFRMANAAQMIGGYGMDEIVF